MPRFPFVAVLLLALLLPATASGQSKAPHISWVKCARLCGDSKSEVQRSGDLKIAGRRFTKGTRVVFPARGTNGRRTTRSMPTTLTGTTRLKVKVPSNALSGRVYVRVKGGKRSNSKGPIKLVKAQPPPNNVPANGSPKAFEGDGMWIWQLEKVEGGNVQGIIARAKQFGIETVFVKAGDTTKYWDQFNAELINPLKAAGIKVCAWQYVEGGDPEGEAGVAARAIGAGADCFVIDAEIEYERGDDRYTRADTYMKALRGAVGADYPIGLTGFPYVDVHGAFPYSAFLGPGGAQVNMPQAYWRDIDDTVDETWTRTMEWNRPYGRTIAPIGMTYKPPSGDQAPPEELTRFRQLAKASGVKGISYWSWQHTEDPEWAGVGSPFPDLTGAPPSAEFAEVARPRKGDLVVWAQRLLVGAGHQMVIDGDFGPGTTQAVAAFQQSKGLGATGRIDSATWRELLKVTPAAQPKRAPKAAEVRSKRPADAAVTLGKR